MVVLTTLALVGQPLQRLPDRRGRNRSLRGSHDGGAGVRRGPADAGLALAVELLAWWREHDQGDKSPQVASKARDRHDAHQEAQHGAQEEAPEASEASDAPDARDDRRPTPPATP